ncbi:lysozyme inhibitor LprI family protein [Stenotrophomonas sp.]|uniref:lysozyme inhibitor LprI family protein n=1 Tax=Stenotrophomonas sp. TaxID=69392 RepID=UPI0028A96C54|nr:lysozyme inhibitor LprI family protein [Stenotrophomonas sp.]
MLAVLVLACAYPAAAAAAPPPRTSDGMSCDSPNQSQAGLNQCASNGAKTADAELNRVYAKVLAANADDKVFLEKFKAAQRAWVAFRDAQIAARYPSPADYGSVLPMCQSNEYEQLTRDRVKQLNAWVAGTEEGDVCAGSYPMSGK